MKTSYRSVHIGHTNHLQPSAFSLKLNTRAINNFGALSGQGLVQIKLGNYEKAIKSYQAVQKIYPSIRAAEIMIPQLQELIKAEAI